MRDEYGFKHYELLKDFPEEGFATGEELDEFILANASYIPDEWEDCLNYFYDVYAERFGIDMCDQ